LKSNQQHLLEFEDGIFYSAGNINSDTANMKKSVYTFLPEYHKDQEILSFAFVSVEGILLLQISEMAIVPNFVKHIYNFLNRRRSWW
jgi:hypothetical protein